MTSWLVGLAWAALVMQLGSALVLWFNHAHTPDLDDEPLLPENPGSLPPPTLAVVVPARNEEANIGACIAALAASPYPGLLIRVVDDGSTDRTGRIAREIALQDPRVEVIAGEPLPPGWLGKNHALRVGTRGLKTDFLLYVDADLRVAPDCLGKVMAAAVRTRADLLTMIPRLEAIGFWELAVQPLMGQLIYGWMPSRDINDPKNRRAGGIGPFMLFKRDAYERIGGHEAVRSEVVEDLKLAELVKKSGLKLVLARGVRLASLRMYDTLPAIVKGWSKNFHIALGKAFWLAPLVAALIFFFAAAPWILPLAAVVSHESKAVLIAAASLVAAVLARLDLARRYGITPRALWLAPLGAAVIAYIAMRSAFRAATGRSFDWKGRNV